MPELTIVNVSKSFVTTKVLDDISLEIAQGELLVLLGPSGCGKSTLLRLVAGLEDVDEGEIYLGHRRLDKLRPRDRNVAMVFQNYALYPHMTVEKNVAFPLIVAGMGKDEIKARVRETARLLGLVERLEDRPSQLSGGQRQRVALGRAIVRNPDLFLLDEPLSNLDADLRARMRQEIVGIQKRLGTTTLYVTHDQTEALTMADRIAVLHEGRIVQVGTPKELYRQPATRFVAEFIGQPKINIVEIRDGDQLTSPFGLEANRRGLIKKQEGVAVGLRPEAVTLEGKGPFSGQVTACEYLGDQHVVTISFQGIPLHVSGSQMSIEAGNTVSFGFDFGDLLFFDLASGRKLV